MAPLFLAALKFIGSAVATAAAGKAVDMAVPKKGIVPTGAVPDAPAMDLNSLVGQQQKQPSKLPQPSLQNRLPRPY